MYAEAECNQDEGSDQTNYTFEHEIECQRTEGVDPLDITAPHTKGYIEGYS